MKTPSGRAQLRDNPLPMWQLVAEERWDRVRLLSSTANRDLVGRTFADISESRDNDDGWDTLFDLLVEEAPRIQGMMLTSDAFAEADIQMVLEHPLCSVESDTTAMGTDGPFAGRMAGVHGYNWAPMFLARYVRDLGILTLEEGVRRLTGLPADRLGLTDRGYLREGSAADVVVLDPDAMRAETSFENPTVYADGVDHVVVNGELVFTEGDRTGRHGGRVLRRGG